MKRTIILFLSIIPMSGLLFGQVSISNDNSTPDPSAGLEIKDTGKGFLPPRMNRNALYAIPNPANGLFIFCTDCGPAQTGKLVVYRNSGWKYVQSDCILPGAPDAGTQSATYNSVTWQWTASAGATGYRWGTTPSYSNSISMGTLTQYTETGLLCTWSYTRYVWAENACGHSDSLIISQTTPACPWTCGQNIIDPRDSKEYGTVQIGTQCWFRQNLNVGTRINGTQHPSNNGVIEKYCYNNVDANCTTYGGMYRWGEMVQYLNGATDSATWVPAPTGNVQGICPSGWHLPTESEWTTLVNYLGGSSEAGGKMKESTLSHWSSPNTGASNSSGFTGLPGGYRHPNGSFYNLTTDGFYRSLTQGSAIGTSYPQAGRQTLSYIAGSTGYSQIEKRYGFYIRCLKDN